MTDELEVLLADGVIDEVLGRLKSGKEANISLVRRGDDVIAAKVYKDRATRSFKNNAEYKEGRKVRNSRTQRAMDSGGKFGREAAEDAWKSAEADALYRLADSGVRIPAPVLFYEGVLLMELVRDVEGRPAPRLIEITIEREAALGLYADLVAQIISMLCCDLIHGDLSPYNILLAADGPTIIDFPQVISAVHNSRAEHFFLRDFDTVVRFFAGFDPSLAVHTADGRAIWRAYVSRELTPQFVPPPPPPPRPTRGPDRRSRPDDRGRAPQRGPSRPDDRGRAPQRGPASQDSRWRSAPPQAGRGGPPRDDRSPPQGGRGGPPRDDRWPPQGGRGGPPRDDRPRSQHSEDAWQASPPRPPENRPAMGSARHDPRPQGPRGDWAARRPDAAPSSSPRAPSYTPQGGGASRPPSRPGPPGGNRRRRPKRRG